MRDYWLELVIAIAILLPTAALAHGGGLDGYGCHHNRKQGGYHCHRGQMAGQSFSSQQEMLSAMNKQDKRPAPSGDAAKPSKK